MMKVFVVCAVTFVLCSALVGAQKTSKPVPVVLLQFVTLTTDWQCPK